MTDPATTALLAAQDGDPSAFAAFVSHTRDDVTRYCQHLGDSEQVEDLVQDTYLLPWQVAWIQLGARAHALGGDRGSDGQPGLAVPGCIGRR